MRRCPAARLLAAELAADIAERAYRRTRSQLSPANGKDGGAQGREGAVKPYTTLKWGILWRSKSKLSGRREHLVGEGCGPVLFPTRSEARQHLESRYGYIRQRPDLQQEPHGWRVPKVVRVRVDMRVVSA